MLKFVIKLRDYLSDLIVNVVPVLSILMILYLLTVFIKFFSNEFFQKSGSHLPKKKIRVFCFIEGPLKTMKNAFYFVLKPLFVLKIFKHLSWLFGHDDCKVIMNEKKTVYFERIMDPEPAIKNLLEI